MKLLFERSRKDRGESLIPPCDCTPYKFNEDQLRKDRPNQIGRAHV